MSHFTVLVDCGPHSEYVRYATLDACLEPFCESGVLTDEQCAESPYHTLIHDAEYGEVYYTNPNSFWDWWVLGGRYRGYLLVRNGAKLAELGAPGAFDNGPRRVPEQFALTHEAVDLCLKGDIDDEAMSLRQIDLAQMGWDQYQEQIKEGHKPFFWGESEEVKQAVLDGDHETYMRLTVRPWATYSMLAYGGTKHGGDSKEGVRVGRHEQETPDRQRRPRDE